MNKRLPFLAGMILTLIAVWVTLTPTPFIHSLIDRLDNLGYDLQLRAKVLTRSKFPVTSVAIVDIDDKSLHKEGHWPWQRSTLARLVDKLHEQGAVVIAFDLFFPEANADPLKLIIHKLTEHNLLDTTQLNVLSSIIKNNANVLDEDAIFAKALSENSVVLAISFLPRIEQVNFLPPPLALNEPVHHQDLDITKPLGYITSIPVLQKAAKYGGFINIFPDNDGIIRHAPLLMQYKNEIYPALSLQAVLSYLGSSIKLIAPIYGDKPRLEGIQIGSSVIPTDDRGEVLIPFVGKSYSFPFYSATDVLNNQIPKDALLGKIVFIGTSATGLGDLQATSIESPFPGVEIQATLTHNLLNHSFAFKPAWTTGAIVVITILCGLIATFLFPYLGPKTLGPIILLFPACVLFINNLLWEKIGLIISMLIPIILVIVIAAFNLTYGYIFETRRRERLKEMFGQYVPGKHIDRMLKSPASYALTGEDREMSVLFADIRNFTSISETMSATQIVEMLNTFFTPMTEIIFNHKGTIDKYVGDLIMAFWGAPLKDKSHARHAIAAALQMQAKLKELHPYLKERGYPEIKIGIGINSGIMSVGDMGSRYRRNYTVLGDAVNLASRIEGLAKFYDAGIIVTEATYQNQPFIFRLLDKVRVKGKKAAVAIYDPICTPQTLSPELKKELGIYHQALDHYFAQRWDDALAILNDLQENYPRKKIYKIYTLRIGEFKLNPPPKDWDGVFEHANK